MRDVRGRYREGSWLVVFTPTAAVMVDDGLPPDGVDRLWRTLVAAGGVDEIVGELTARGLAELPAFGVVVTERRVLRALLRPGVALVADRGDGHEVRVETLTAATWTEEVIPVPARVRLVGAGAPRDPAGDGPPGQLPVIAGVVRADEVTWEPVAAHAVTPPAAPRRGADAPSWSAEAAVVTVQPDLPAPHPAADGAGPVSPPGRLVSDVPFTVPSCALPARGGVLIDTVPARARCGTGAEDLVTSPLVHAILCPDRHPNPVPATSCRRCGVPLDFSPAELVRRPPLGRLRFTTGQEAVLDRDVIVGRAPSTTRLTDGNLPRLVRVDGPGLDISRNHLQVRLEGWHVLVVDLGSRNGTLVTLPGRPPQLLDAYVPCLVTAGTVVTVADGVSFVYECEGCP
jgi:hypothetical protein